jgi:hypothetical protein
MKRSKIHLSIIVLGLSLVLAVQGSQATESSEFDSSINSVEEPFSPDARVSLPVTLESDENFSFDAVSETPDADIHHATQGGLYRRAS